MRIAAITVLIILTTASISQASDAAVHPINHNDKLRMVAEILPEFGGIYLENGTIHAYMVGASEMTAETASQRKQDLREALSSVFGDDWIRPQDSIEFIDATYTMTALSEWYQSLRSLLELDEVTFTDLDEGKNRLRFGIHPDRRPDAALARVAALGIPDEAVVMEFENYTSMAKVTSRIRPIVGGIQIKFGFGNRCTLGFNAVVDDVIQGFVTNSHCTNTQGGTEGTVYKQPKDGLLGANRVGTEFADPAYTATLSGCPVGRVCRLSDSAFVAYDNGVSFDLGKFARPDGWGSKTISAADPDFELRSGLVAVAFLTGTVLRKVGRTTGLTAGVLDGTCIDVNAGANITLMCQWEVDADPTVGGGVSPIADFGDSGSPVFMRFSSPNPDNEVALFGILWGGSSVNDNFIFSSLADVNAELKPIVGNYRLK